MAVIWRCACGQVNWTSRNACRACGHIWAEAPRISPHPKPKKRGKSRKAKDSGPMAARVQSNLFDAMHNAAANRNSMQAQSSSSSGQRDRRAYPTTGWADHSPPSVESPPGPARPNERPRSTSRRPSERSLTPVRGSTPQGPSMVVDQGPPA
eukprot:5713668-Alexandrium_andersonii.AAC.1